MPIRTLTILASLSLASLLSAAEPKPAGVLKMAGEITWIAFSPDSKLIATGSQASPNLVDENDFEMRVWDAATGKVVGVPVKGAGIGACAAVSPDGKSLVTGGTNGQWRLWSFPALKAIAKGEVGDFCRVDRIAFAPDGKLFSALETTYYGKRKVRYDAHTFDTATGKEVGKTFRWPSESKDRGEPAGWTLSNDPEFKNDGTPLRPKVIEPLEVPGDEPNGGGPTAAAISRDRKRAVSAGVNGNLILWDYANRKPEEKPLATYNRLGINEHGLSISADGKRIAVAYSTEHSTKGHQITLTVFDGESRKAVVGPADLGWLGVGLVNEIDFSPDGTMLAIAFTRLGSEIKDATHEVQLWSVPK